MYYLANSLTSSLIKGPLTIADQTVIIIPDMVGPVPIAEQHEYVETVKATNTCAAISMRESDIELARAEHPELAVYGLWQLLIHNQCLSLDTDLQIAPLNDQDGFYIVCETGRFQYSGNYEAGFFAADSRFNIATADKIQLTMNTLTLPQRPARLAREILESHRSKAMKTTLIAGAIGVGVAFAGICVDLILQANYQQNYALVAEKNEILAALEQEYAGLNIHHLNIKPDNTATIHKLALIIDYFPQAKTVSKNSFDESSRLLEINSMTDPKLLLDWLNTVPKPNGQWAIRF